MKKLNVILSIATISLFVVSCGNNAASLAEEACECTDKLGIEDADDLEELVIGGNYKEMRKIEEKAEEHLPKCLLKIAEEIEEEMDGMDKDGKVKYVKDFLKAALETSCSDIMLEAVPYDMMGAGLKEAKKQIERQEEYRKERERYENEYDY